MPFAGELGFEVMADDIGCPLGNDCPIPGLHFNLALKVSEMKGSLRVLMALLLANGAIGVANLFVK